MGAPREDFHNGRYSRQLLCDDFNEGDQRRLLDSRVVILGAGGLGSPIIQYLAGVGVGTIRIVDAGEVKLSNLHRQVIYAVDDIGEPKVESAARFVERLNPDVTVEPHRARFTRENADSIVANADVVLDGLDNFRGRFLANDITRIEDTPFVHGGIYGWEGQAAVFVPGGPCYRCLVPEVPEDAGVRDDEPMAVIPPVPGVIGAVQAAEAIKILLRRERLLDDRVLRFDATDASFLETPLQRSEHCGLCGPDGIDSIEDIDYDGRCRIRR